MDEAAIILEQNELALARTLLAEIERHIGSHTHVDPDDLKAGFSNLISDVIYMREQELDLRLNDIEARKEIEHQRIEAGMQMIGIKTNE